MWQLAQLPATDLPLHIFLLNHTDVIIVLSSAPIAWHLTRRQKRRTAYHSLGANEPTQTTIPRVAHRLRQVFTVMLLGVGLIKRKASGKGLHEIQRLVEQLRNAVDEGVKAVNELDPPKPIAEDGLELMLGA
jgi:hypothetical protein